MVNKKFLGLGILVLILVSGVFISPTLTGNAIGPVSRQTSGLIGGLLVFLLGIVISLSLKKE